MAPSYPPGWTLAYPRHRHAYFRDTSRSAMDCLSCAGTNGAWTVGVVEAMVGWNGLRDVRNGRIGDRPFNPGAYGGGGSSRSLAPAEQSRQRDVELSFDSRGWAIFPGNGLGATASRIPPSQSCVPFLSRGNLTRTNPLVLSHFVTSETE